MQRAAISYRDGRLEALEQDDVWTVRWGRLEARSSYLDLALLGLLDDAREVHRLAARLLFEFVDAADVREAADVHVTSARPRRRRYAARATPLLVGLRAFVLLVVASMAFMLTTWLSAIW